MPRTSTSSAVSLSPSFVATSTTTSGIRSIPHHMSPPPMAKSKTFPWKLHEMLQLADHEGFEKIVSWLPDGKSFKVHNTREFVKKVMPNFFLQSKYKSFQRQLNLWGFERLTNGPGKGGYRHPCFFFRDNEFEIAKMERRKAKGSSLTSSKPDVDTESGIGHSVALEKLKKQRVERTTGQRSKIAKAETKRDIPSEKCAITATVSAQSSIASTTNSRSNIMICAKQNSKTETKIKGSTKSKKASSLAVSVISQGSSSGSDCELHSVTPPKMFTTHMGSVLNSFIDTGDLSQVKSDLTNPSTTFSSTSTNNDMQLRPQCPDETPSSSCPQTGDCMSFEGRKYFFLDEEDLPRNPLPRHVSTGEEGMQSQMLITTTPSRATTPRYVPVVSPLSKPAPSVPGISSKTIFSPLRYPSMPLPLRTFMPQPDQLKSSPFQLPSHRGLSATDGSIRRVSLNLHSDAMVLPSQSLLPRRRFQFNNCKSASEIESNHVSSSITVSGKDGNHIKMKDDVNVISSYKEDEIPYDSDWMIMDTIENMDLG